MALRVGIIGAGRSGTHHARELTSYPDVHVTAVADPDRSKRDAFAKSFNTRLAVSDPHRLSKDTAIDLIYVCSPPSTHSAICVDALKAGKDVICDQPMATTMSQGEEMIAASKESGKRLFIALPQRYDPINQEAVRIIDADEIGYPFLTLLSYIENDYDRLNDWHDWLGTWDIAGGGILMQRGSELIDLLHYCMGSIEGVNAVCTRFAIQSLNKAEDSCLLELEFREEILAQLSLTGAARYSPWPKPYTGSAMRLDIYGLDGGIQILNASPRLIVVTKGTGYREITESEIKTDLPTDMNRDFIDCILEGKDPLVSADDALETLKVILAGYKASQMKRRVETMENL